MNIAEFELVNKIFNVTWKASMLFKQQSSESADRTGFSVNYTSD